MQKASEYNAPCDDEVSNTEEMVAFLVDLPLRTMQLYELVLIQMLVLKLSGT